MTIKPRLSCPDFAGELPHVISALEVLSYRISNQLNEKSRPRSFHKWCYRKRFRIPCFANHKNALQTLLRWPYLYPYTLRFILACCWPPMPVTWTFQSSARPWRSAWSGSARPTSRPCACRNLVLARIGIDATLWFKADAISVNLIAALAWYAAFWALCGGFFRLRGADGLRLGNAKLMAAGAVWVGPLGSLGVLFLASLSGILAILVRSVLSRGVKRGQSGPITGLIRCNLGGQSNGRYW